MKRAAIFLVRGYRRVISPVLPPLCRYEPTCSQYMETAIEQHGAVKGVWLGLRRLGRCTPWGGSGYDPVPEPTGHDSRR